jgi:ankyrin repeat protein/serine/threonine protein kinase
MLHSDELASYLTVDRCDIAAISKHIQSFPEAALTRCTDNDFPLHVAVSSNCAIEIVELILDAAPEIVRLNGKCGRSALLRACDAGARIDERILLLLASRYPEALFTGFWTWLPIHSISNVGQGRGILAILSSYPEAAREICKDGELFALHFACDRVDADADAVAALLAAHPAAVKEVGGDGNLPLHLACRKGAPLSVVRMLIDAFPESLKEKGENNMLPLHLACACNIAVDSVISELIRLGPEALRIKCRKRLPLHIASASAPVGVVLLILGAWPDAVRERGLVNHFALHFACNRSDADVHVISALLNAFSDAIRIKNEAENLPLHCACLSGAPLSVVRLLIDANPEAVSSFGHGGWLPIYGACNCKVSVAEVGVLLLKMKPDSARFRTTYNIVPLQAAAMYAPAEFIKVILAAWPEAAKESNGRFSLHYACDRLNADPGVVVALLSAYADAVQLKDNKGDLPLHIACRCGAFSVVQTLLAAYPEATLIESGQGGKKCSFPLSLALESKVTPPESIVRSLLLASLSAPSSSLRPWQEIWVSFLYDSGETYFSAVEEVLNKHFGDIELLANATDASGRRALGVAVGSVSNLIQSRLFLFGRFELASGKPEHISATSIVRFAIDHGVDPAARVALKFMRHRDAFAREFACRSLTGVELSKYSSSDLKSAVLPILASFDSDSNDEIRKELIARSLGSHIYVIVLPAADRSLAAIIDHEREIENWSEEAEHAAKQIVVALSQLHSHGIVHGDIKPRNVVRIDSAMTLIDMDAAARIGASVAPKVSTAYAPPEIAQALLAACLEDEGNNGAGALANHKSLQASISMDAWAFGMTLFTMLTGSTLFHSDSADNAVGGLMALKRLAEWSDSTKTEALWRHPLSREARSLLSQLLHKLPERRPTMLHVLCHPFFTGRPVARLPGESPAWDVFVSYRVASDADARSALVSALERLGLSVWSDARLAIDSAGDLWRDAFCQALATSRVFVPIISRNAVNAGTETPARHWPSLLNDSPIDNVMLEHRLALELVEHGLCEAIAPVLLGDILPGVGHGERGNFFKQGCTPDKLPMFPLRSVEEELARQTDKLGLGLPLTTDVSVADIWKRIVSDRQAYVGVGQVNSLFENAAAYVHRSVFKHGIVASHSPSSLLSGTSREDMLSAELASCQAQVRELSAKLSVVNEVEIDKRSNDKRSNGSC